MRILLETGPLMLGAVDSSCAHRIVRVTVGWLESELLRGVGLDSRRTDVRRTGDRSVAATAMELRALAGRGVGGLSCRWHCVIVCGA